MSLLNFGWDRGEVRVFLYLNLNHIIIFVFFLGVCDGRVENLCNLVWDIDRQGAGTVGSEETNMGYGDTPSLVHDALEQEEKRRGGGGGGRGAGDIN